MEAREYVEATIQAGPSVRHFNDRRCRAALDAGARAAAGVERELSEKPQQAVALIEGPVEVSLPLPGLVDLDRSASACARSWRAWPAKTPASRAAWPIRRSPTRRRRPWWKRSAERLAAGEERTARIQERLAALGG